MSVQSLLNPRKAEGHILSQDYVTGKWFKIDALDGTTQPCTEHSTPIPVWTADVSGCLDKKERRLEGFPIDSINVLEEAKLPKRLVLPYKYTGYVQVPRPQVDRHAPSGFALPSYLQPQEHGIKGAKDFAPKKKVRRTTLPSFSKALDTQLASDLNMTQFTKTGGDFYQMQNQVHVDAAAMVNKQMMLSDVESALDVLRAQRTSTKGRFGQEQPPYNARELREMEDARYKLLNPRRWAEKQRALEEDKKLVDRRRREKYVKYFEQKDEEERLLKEAQIEASLQ